MNKSKESNEMPHASSSDRWVAFTRSPFALPSAMLAAVLVGMGGAALLEPRPSEQPPQQVALAPSFAPQPPQPAAQPVSEEAPVVTIRPLAERPAPKPAPGPASADGGLNPQLPAGANVLPGAAAIPGTLPVKPRTEPAAPEAAAPEIELEAPPTPPAAMAPVATTRVEKPRVETPRIETPPAEPKPPRRRRIVRAAAPRPSGKLSIYFDADSSTFDQGKNRAPLRVEVFVGGRKVMETNDPEKREFNVADLPEGVHEVSIVPHVGDAQPRPRHFRVEVGGNEETRVKAVLRRRDGEALIGKLRARD